MPRGRRWPAATARRASAAPARRRTARRDQAKAPQILGGQIDAPVLRVLAQVAQDVRELQRHPQVVGEPLGAPRGRCRRGRAAEDRQARPPDRAGHTPAVEHELVETLIGDALDVHAHALDQLAERIGGQREAHARVGQRDDHRIGACGRESSRSSGRAPGPRRPVGAASARAQRPVADVVDAASERVHRAHRAPLRAGSRRMP